MAVMDALLVPSSYFISIFVRQIGSGRFNLLSSCRQLRMLPMDGEIMKSSMAI